NAFKKRNQKQNRTASSTATTTTPMTDAAIRTLIAQGMADALVGRTIQKTLTSMAIEAKVLEVTVGHDPTYGMPWKTLMKMMTIKYCARSEIKELEIKIWNLKESDEVEKYVDGLFDMIQGSVMASKPKTMQEAIEIANDLINQKRYNVAQAYAAGTVERKEYARTLLLYNKCKFHHNDPYIAKTITCYECEIQEHYKSDCPKLKNQNHGNQVQGTEARGMVYALGGEKPIKTMTT
nr:hypothetical protein [Tanacetum cinerariifolium]